MYKRQPSASAYPDSASYKITGTKTKYTIKEDVYKRQPVVHEALKRAGVTKEELRAVAFTRGPGLMLSLIHI